MRSSDLQLGLQLTIVVDGATEGYGKVFFRFQETPSAFTESVPLLFTFR